MTDQIATTDIKTEEEIAQDYSAMLDSVNLINEMKTNPPVDVPSADASLFLYSSTLS